MKNSTQYEIAKRIAIKLKKINDLECGDNLSLMYIEGRIDQMLEQQKGDSFNE